MTLNEAVKLWVNNDFSLIPISLIKRAYKDNPDDLKLLTKKIPELDYPSGCGWLFHPDNKRDEDWIRNNIDLVEDCGFMVYQSDETGILLGIDGIGYDHIKEHWKPLYEARWLY